MNCEILRYLTQYLADFPFFIKTIMIKLNKYSIFEVEDSASYSLILLVFSLYTVTEPNLRECVCRKKNSLKNCGTTIQEASRNWNHGL